MEQKVPFGPSWARAKWDFLLHLEKRPDPGAAAGHRPPGPADSAAEEAGGAHRRSLRRPGSAPPAPRRRHRPNLGARERKGALLSEGPLGDLEAKPGFEPGVKALQASALPLGHFAVDMKRADSKTGPMHAMERTTGLEPATPTLARLCSTN